MKIYENSLKKIKTKKKSLTMVIDKKKHAPQHLAAAERKAFKLVWSP
jgi:hypothetical protein